VYPTQYTVTSSLEATHDQARLFPSPGTSVLVDHFAIPKVELERRDHKRLSLLTLGFNCRQSVEQCARQHLSARTECKRERAWDCQPGQARPGERWLVVPNRIINKTKKEMETSNLTKLISNRKHWKITKQKYPAPKPAATS
jgi:hypothetical protein